MALSPRRYSQQFREKAVRMVERGANTVPQVAKRLGMPQQTLRNWVRKSKKEMFDFPDPNPVDQLELYRLRIENDAMRRDLESLKAVMVAFAKVFCSRVL